MYIVDINVFENREVKINEKQAGNTFENNETVLSFSIPECYKDYYKYLDIAMDDKKTQTVVSVKNESKFTYKLPLPLTEGLTLYLQLVLKKGESVFKSNVFTFSFNPSLCATQVLESEFIDSIEYLFEEKADKEELYSLKELLDLKTDKTTFYSYFDAQTKINGEKVDKVEGKELSSNDFDDSYKEKLDNLDSSLNEKVDKEDGKGLSENSFTTIEKEKLNNLPDDTYSKEESDALLNSKVDKVSGKGLSENDFTSEEKEKLFKLPTNEALTDNFTSVETELNLKADKEYVDSVSSLANENNKSIKAIEDVLTNEENNFSNAIKSTKEGKFITADDVSPTKHFAKIWARGKNLLYLPDYETTYGGVTFTISNGKITTKGTGIDGAVLKLTNGYKTNWTASGWQGEYFLPAGTYTLSMQNKNGTGAGYYPTIIAITQSGQKCEVNWYDATIRSKTITANEPIACIYCVVGQGLTIDCEFNIQFEKGSTMTDYEVGPDLSKVKLIKNGKNLFTLDNDERFTKKEDGSYINNTSISENVIVPIFIPKGTYTLSYDLKAPEGCDARIMLIDKADNQYYAYSQSTGKYVRLSKTFTATEDIVAFKIGYAATPLVNTLEIKNILLEVGEKETGYEEYSKEDYLVAEDGTVEGATMNYPVTTLFTDTSGITITATYNKDINKAISELTQAIISLGGNI